MRERGSWAGVQREYCRADKELESETGGLDRDRQKEGDCGGPS
jgi:hypothetical protein